ncbi:hypothetical protein A2U01_0102963, partial [Trifolium medium]|nr:hypothetical protein [Trifolium medium]
VVSENVYHSVKLHPTHGFCWEREDIEKPFMEDEFPSAYGWGDLESYDD